MIRITLNNIESYISSKPLRKGQFYSNLKVSWELRHIRISKEVTIILCLYKFVRAFRSLTKIRWFSCFKIYIPIKLSPIWRNIFAKNLKEKSWALAHPQLSSYNPEVFSGLIYKMVSPQVNLWLVPNRKKSWTKSWRHHIQYCWVLEIYNPCTVLNNPWELEFQ